MSVADKANEYIDTKKPWALNKEADRQAEVVDICSVCLNIFRQLVIYLAPVLPKLAEDAKLFLNIDELSFASRHNLLLGHTINTFKPLMNRIEKEKIDIMVNASKENLSPQASNTTTEYIGIDDFAKVQMTVAHVLACQKVEGANKLLQFSLDVGEDQPRNVFSGIAKFYQPEELTGKKVICITNLAPRKMKFGISEGMILSAEKDGQLQVVILPDDMKIGAKLA